jgi:hypothetical protein
MTAADDNNIVGAGVRQWETNKLRAEDNTELRRRRLQSHVAQAVVTLLEGCDPSRTA